MHACGRAWQLFDWVRVLPDDHDLKRLCDAGAYTAMIALCGTWQQLRRALQLVADMRARSLECGQQVGCYSSGCDHFRGWIVRLPHTPKDAGSSDCLCVAHQVCRQCNTDALAMLT